MCSAVIFNLKLEYLQPKDIFYPLTSSWPWLFYKPPDKTDTSCSKSDCSIKINTVELLHCTFNPLPASYWCPGRHQQIIEETLFKRSTFTEKPLDPFRRWLHNKCSEVIWLPWTLVYLKCKISTQLTWRGGHTYGHTPYRQFSQNPNFLDAYYTKFSYPSCSAMHKCSATVTHSSSVMHLSM